MYLCTRNDGADYTVKASDADAPYLVDIWLKDLVDELGDEETVSELPSGEEFIAWAVAVDVNGKPQGKFYTEKFTTPKE